MTELNSIEPIKIKVLGLFFVSLYTHQAPTVLPVKSDSDVMFC